MRICHLTFRLYATLGEPNRGEPNVGEVLRGNEPKAIDLAKPNPRRQRYIAAGAYTMLLGDRLGLWQIKVYTTIYLLIYCQLKLLRAKNEIINI